MDIIHVSTRGQIVIPERVRKAMKIKEGSRLILLEKGNTLILKKEEDIEKLLDKETRGWVKISENSLKAIWDNPQDEKEWKRYL